MNLSERQKKILNGVVETYIETAEPVGSKLLEEKYDLGLCSASIRIEMQKLADQGFILQPHTSAGRIPTDKGYRFFVDNFLEKELMEEDDFFDFKEETDSPIKFIQFITNSLALVSSNLVLGYLEEEEVFWKNGWEKIIREPEFEKKEIIDSFVEMIGELEKKLVKSEISSEVKIYIGKENPFSRSEEFSTIVTGCCLPKERNGLIAIIGPKRMDYGGNINRLNFLLKNLKENNY
jgi:transcriptional regulator of heat shock response